MNKKIILASGSPRRKELLEQIGIEFEVITSDAPEISHATTPEDIVMELSACKAKAVFDDYFDARKNNLSLEANDVLSKNPKNFVIIGADTLVFDGLKRLGKPKDSNDACRMLRELSGKTHKVYTGVTLICDNEIRSFYEAAEVSVCDMTDEEIEAYVATGDPLDKAGAYGIQGMFAAYVKGIRGDYNTIVGLPVCRLYHELKQTGWLFHLYK